MQNTDIPCTITKTHCCCSKYKIDHCVEVKYHWCTTNDQILHPYPQCCEHEKECYAIFSIGDSCGYSTVSSPNQCTDKGQSITQWIIFYIFKHTCQIKPLLTAKYPANSQNRNHKSGNYQPVSFLIVK